MSALPLSPGEWGAGVPCPPLPRASPHLHPPLLLLNRARPAFLPSPLRSAVHLLSLTPQSTQCKAISGPQGGTEPYLPCRAPDQGTMCPDPHSGPGFRLLFPVKSRPLPSASVPLSLSLPVPSLCPHAGSAPDLQDLSWHSLTTRAHACTHTHTPPKRFTHLPLHFSKHIKTWRPI